MTRWSRFNRLGVPAIAAVVGASLLAAACGGSVGQSPNVDLLEDLGPPNILLIVGDQTGAVTGGAAAGIADDGVRFAKMASVGPASRGSVRSVLLTGLSPASLGLDREDIPEGEDELNGSLTAVPFPEVRVFPEFLRRAGYFTVRRGRAMHNLSAGGGTPPRN